MTNRPPTPPAGNVVAEFLADLARQGRSANTIRAYRSDLGHFTRVHPGPLALVTPAVLRAYLATLANKMPTTRARREAALASLLAWAYRAELIDADPMTRLDRTRIPSSPPRPMPTGHVDAVLRAIPQHKHRDRLLFTLLSTTGMRIGEALAIDVDDLDLTHDDEHVTVLAKGGRRRTILLDDPILVSLLRRYLTARGYRHGPLFRAEKNHVGGALCLSTAAMGQVPHQSPGRRLDPPTTACSRHRTGQRRRLTGDHPTPPGPRQRPDGPALRRSARCHDRRRDRSWRRRKTTGRSGG